MIYYISFHTNTPSDYPITYAEFHFKFAIIQYRGEREGHNPPVRSFLPPVCTKLDTESSKITLVKA